ncbi:glycoside hydrolase family 35 protein [Paenibacillus spongiae]|uniref:Beta-galactosidase n=1 Tax=Paenibacillus spongiae TaxID=2909671 RepID=A0ABY5S426_9BACL|nr:beta-galactosidase family protein [Paenibacillus spongiae]UVI27612.1 beta-galactosidase [Paenibacillus spongiae]
MRAFDTAGNNFVLNGNPIRLISGAIHYFRVVPEYWKDRLQKLKACGFNTVETYVPWNLHEPEEGQFVFDGMADIVRFIETAGELGLHVIVRPSPYICAEWEFGGMPGWLLANSDIRLRCMDQAFLDKVDAYYDVLLPKLKPLQITNGGPIIAMQIENEYGSYGNDVEYLTYLKTGMEKRGIDVLLFTSDGPDDSMLQGGMVPGVLETVNFGSRAAESFDKLREYQPDKPVMCMEYWNGWFDHWREEHHTRGAQDVAQVLQDMLDQDASVNFYMFHGGTNFGYYNGANHSHEYEPTITSYDYDSPLSENGELTKKYEAVRDVIRKFTGKEPECELPQPLPKRSYGEVRLSEKASLFEQLEQLSKPVKRTCPDPMEKLGQSLGFILYSCHVSGPRPEMQLTIQDVHDRALVFLDGEYIGVVERWNPKSIPVRIPAGGAKLDILVENMGRINYGPYLKDYKGITEGVRLNNQFLFGWTIYPLPLTGSDTGALTYQSVTDEKQNGPTFYRGTFEAHEAADTFIRLDGWVKGNIYINGFHLGRYWEAGPQKTLYIPGPLLKQGLNEIVIFELHQTDNTVVSLVDTPDLG